MRGKLATFSLLAAVTSVVGCWAGSMTQYTYYYSPSAETGNALRDQRHEVHPVKSTMDGPPDRLELVYPDFVLRIMVVNDKEVPLTAGVGVLPPVVPVVRSSAARNRRMVTEDEPLLVLAAFTGVRKPITIDPGRITIVMPTEDSGLVPIRTWAVAQLLKKPDQSSTEPFSFGPDMVFGDPPQEDHITLVYPCTEDDPKEFVLRTQGVYVNDQHVAIPDITFVRKRDFVVSLIH